MIEQILHDLVAAVPGARAAIFLDGEGETIAQSGGRDFDVRLIGAWKELELDRIREMSKRFKLGEVRAVLFSMDRIDGLVAPVADEYCLLLLLSPAVNIHIAITGIKNTIESLKKEIG